MSPSSFLPAVKFGIKLCKTDFGYKQKIALKSRWLQHYVRRDYLHFKMQFFSGLTKKKNMWFLHGGQENRLIVMFIMWTYEL